MDHFHSWSVTAAAVVVMGRSAGDGGGVVELFLDTVGNIMKKELSKRSYQFQV